jgi:hypothetical protein
MGSLPLTKMSSIDRSDRTHGRSCYPLQSRNALAADHGLVIAERRCAWRSSSPSSALHLDNQ